jgi:hypothetical protein
LYHPPKTLGRQRRDLFIAVVAQAKRESAVSFGTSKPVEKLGSKEERKRKEKKAKQANPNRLAFLFS